MAELRRSLAGVDCTTSLRKVPRRSAGTAKIQFDWQILATDFATIILGVSLIPHLVNVLYAVGLGGLADAGAFGSGPVGSVQQIVLGFAFASISTWYFWVHGHYLRRRSSWDRIGDLTFVFACLLFAEVVVRGLWLQSGLPLLGLALQWLGIGTLLLGLRLAVRELLERRGQWLWPTVVLGSRQRALNLARSVAEDRDLGLRVTHILEYGGSGEDEPVTGAVEIGGSHVPVLQTQDLLTELLLRFGGHVILVAPPPGELKPAEPILPVLSKRNAPVGIQLPSFGAPTQGPKTQRLLRQETTLLWLENKLCQPAWQIAKRCIDILGASLGLLLASPLILAVCIAGLIKNEPVFYGHRRIGQNGRPFNCLKFRTMVCNAQQVLDELLARDPEARREWEASYKLKDDPRVTSLGALLRRTSLDELPQLWNVLMGDMSLVGPRPVVEKELLYYGENLQDYLCAKPGLTGLWQISGRSDIGYKRRVALDRWYVRNWCLWYDVVIVFKTIRIVLKRRGAY